MKLKILLVSVLCGLLGSAALAINDNPDFNTKKTLVLSVINENYKGPESVTLSATEDELRNNWLPYVNGLLERENTMKGSSFKEVQLNSDGSVKVTGNIGQGIKNIIKVPFFSSVDITFKPTVYENNLKIQVTKIKLGWFPVSVGVAQKLVSRWVDLNNFVVKLDKFSFENITITDKDATVTGHYRTAGVKATFFCQDGKNIKAEFYKGAPKPAVAGQIPVPTGSIEVTLSDGRKFELQQTVSADGARYANSDESIIFWNKGNALHFYDHNLEKVFTNCRTK